MTSKYNQYASADQPMPEKTLAWNMYGAGEENIGKDGKPEQFPVSQPAADQMLVRIDSVGLCFSDVKLIKMGRKHPKLYNRDLTKEPTRLGHEVCLTVLAVGDELKEKYTPGQRLAVQPDIYQNGKSTAYGYTIPGGLTQYHLMGSEMLETDEGACLLPIGTEMGYAEASLLEPWGCVLASYTQRRRLEPMKGGVMWIIGRPGDEREYTFSAGLQAPATIILSDAPASVADLASKTSAEVVVRDNLTSDQYEAFSQEFTDGAGFDDIVMLDPRSAETVGAVARYIKRRGTLNMVGETPLDGLVNTDAGRLHYDYIAFIGCQGPDISGSYGEKRNRCELKKGGTTVFVGAGGPMGQMHVQRAIELPDGPGKVIATEVSDMRLAAIVERFGPLAKSNNCELFTFNPQTSDMSIHEFVMDVTGGQGADDVVVSVPIAAVMTEAATLMNKDGMLVFFAGVPNGTMADLDMSTVYMANAQYTGTSGLSLDDQFKVMDQASKGALSPGRSVGAIGGMKVAKEGIRAVIEGSFAGKVIIFPEFPDLPLIGLDDLHKTEPEIAAKLGPGNMWTVEAEKVLFEKYWKG
ncbi:zinc-binding dehydrogenase [Desulforhopalus vacuolatus]|uniref:alcohol dehydrogenase catalytic domain-containing protein n=1 Tax=Desulforhopalus vacuolatus TaxID=40414 RepID=UPI001964A0DB|nr:alcohol dehydrogenase catalytic domain-containing protein [Desulforhopalus vacuolatus]MBM9521029.1 zinc-binding dehydrogenase [Desulforhopalus vacuolatus]